MKKTRAILMIGLISLLFIPFQNNIAQTSVSNTISDLENNTIRIHENSYQKLYLTNHFSDYSHITVNTTEGLFEKLQVDNYGLTNKTGYPELPVNVKIIEIPYGADIKVKIVSKKFNERQLNGININHPIYPHQAPVPKNGISNSVFEINEKAYDNDSYFPFDIVRIEELGMMRGIRLARVFISPIQYNPAKSTLRIYSEIDIEISFKHPDIAKSKSLKRNTESLYFNTVYKNILNYKSGGSKDTIVKYPIKYVIVSDPMFKTVLQPFVEWKTKKGFHVIEAYTDDPAVGSTVDSIKKYLEGLYFAGTVSDPPPSFVLLVGDFGQIPAKIGVTGSQITDLYYGEYTGDFLPEVFYGRFSANNVDELQPQIDKTLEYEQYLFPDPSYLNKAVLVSGVDGTHGPLEGNGQVNYVSTYYVKPANGFNPYYYLYPASGNQSANIIQNIDDGVGLFNYTGHGNPYVFQNPSFQMSDVDALTNNHKYPLVIGNACGTNSFGYAVCLGESFLRAENAGAIGYIGVTADCYWSEDYYWSVGFGAITANPTYAGTSLAAYDRTFHMNGEPDTEWFVTQGQMIYGGNLAVMASGSSDWDYYWEIYHLLGDPSLMVYFTEPPPLSVSHAAFLPVGASSFTVITEPYAYVGISMNGILYGAAPSDPNGIATLNLKPLTQAGTADIVVTKQNREPYIDTIHVDYPGGPFIILNKYTLIDSSGNNNGDADFGESISLDIELKNTGSSISHQTSALITTSDTNVTITKNTQNWGDIQAFDSITQHGAFTFDVNEIIPDQNKVYFNLKIQDTIGNVYNSIIIITLDAPELEIGNYFVDDRLSGNDNGRLDPGETADIIIPTYNLGHLDAENASSELLCNSNVISIINTSYNFNVLFSGSSQNAIFTVTVNPQVPVASYQEIEYTVTSSVYQKQKSFFPFIGQVSEDWESGDFTRFNWQDSGNKPWIVTTIDPYEGIYCAKSGDVTDYESSVLSISFEVSNEDSISFYRKVSSEETYDFLEFYIDDDMKDHWSGIKEWERVSFPVSTGYHTFKWVYQKDYGSSVGDDCAWIDLINFPPIASTSSVESDITENDIINFKVYPNPAKDHITFSFNSLNDCRESITIYDNFGREIKEISEFKGKNNRQIKLTIDLHEYNNGVYYAVLSSCTKRETRKFIIFN